MSIPQIDPAKGHAGGYDSCIYMRMHGGSAGAIRVRLALATTRPHAAGHAFAP